MPEEDILLPLAEYDVDETTGFVPPHDPLKRLPDAFSAWEAIVPGISALIRSRRLRAAIGQLPQCDPSIISDRREQERALLLLTVLANGWVWGGDEPHMTIPRQIAIPLCRLADAMGRPPIVHYASMALHNWQRIDAASPVSADNARMQVQFLGGVDEDWFFIASLGVELAGAPLLGWVWAAVIASHRSDDAELAAVLTEVAGGMQPVIAALHRMRDWCDPHIFYLRVRPFLTGWPAPGAVYEGVSSTPRSYVGGSAGQSSLLQAIDALLGISHTPSTTGDYLRALRLYMPVDHRRFVEDVEQRSLVRERVRQGSGQLRAAYNDAVAQVAAFRNGHGNLAQRYIAKPAGESGGEAGTGGTSFADFLQSTHRSTAEAKL